MAIESTSNLDLELLRARWNSLKLYNGYRILIALTLILSHNPAKITVLLHNWMSSTFLIVAIAYLIFSLISGVFTWLEQPHLEVTLPVQTILDVIFILLLMHIDNANLTSIGLLLITAIAAVSLISNGRLALFYAAIATIGILLGQFFNSIFNPESFENYTNAAFLSIACFAIAWLAHSLAKKMQRSEQLASQRGLDLKSLAKVNALITHKMNDGVLVVNNDLFIKHHNLQADAFLNLGNVGLEQKDLRKIAPEIANLLLEWFSEDHGTNATPVPNALRVNIMSRELNVNFMPISENRDQGVVVFIEDWSYMQTQSHQIKLAALGRLTANIAHEIRNPLSSISHANQLMQEEENISSSNQRMLQIISDNVQRLDQIIKDVLELNRRDRTNQETIHLESFITAFHTEFCAVENLTPENFKLSLESTDTTILFDRRHLNQILWNLCKNAWRHSKQTENSLELAVYTVPNSLVVNLEISDNGVGVSEAIREHLFEPFFTTEKTGTGLGLYIGRELAEANGANLQYRPTDSGTKFTMLINKAAI